MLTVRGFCYDDGNQNGGDGKNTIQNPKTIKNYRKKAFTIKSDLAHDFDKDEYLYILFVTDGECKSGSFSIEAKTL